MAIYKQDSCSDFNNAIKEILQDNFEVRETEEITIPQKYISRLDECSSAQIKLLANIGIKRESKWERNALNSGREEYYYLNRDMRKGFHASDAFDYSEVNMNYTFESKIEAENEAKIFNLFMVMRNWVNFHNKIDGFIPDWDNPNQRKYGLSVGDGAITTTSRYLDMELFFHIAVASDQRARELRDEFKQDILEIIKYL